MIGCCNNHKTDYGRAFALGIGLNAAYVVAEAGFGIIANSVALLADAGHNLSDVLGLAMAWFAIVLSRCPPSHRFTYGLRGSSILAALFNAIFLLIAVGAIAWEAVLRLKNPEPTASGTMMIVAASGIIVNGFTAWLFVRGRKGDLNIRSAFLHMTADALVSAGVVAAGLGISLTGWLWLDPVMSLIIVAVIMWSTWDVLREAVSMLLGAVPAGIDRRAVHDYLAGLPGVVSVHDLHIWAMSTAENALTAHIVLPGGHPGDAFLMRASEELERHFGIGHATLQVEINSEICCRLAPDHVV